MGDRPNRDLLVEEALKTLRAARQRIDPGVLNRVREAIAVQAVADMAGPIEVSDSDTRIDRARNMGTIMKFLQLNSENGDMNRKVLALLRKAKN
jgi:hypothetical protein